MLESLKNGHLQAHKYSINNSIMYRFLHENKLPEITRSAVISIIIINAYIMDVYKFTMHDQSVARQVKFNTERGV